MRHALHILLEPTWHLFLSTQKSKTQKESHIYFLLVCCNPVSAAWNQTENWRRKEIQAAMLLSSHHSGSAGPISSGYITIRHLVPHFLLQPGYRANTPTHSLTHSNMHMHIYCRNPTLNPRWRANYRSRWWHQNKDEAVTETEMYVSLQPLFGKQNKRNGNNYLLQDILRSLSLFLLHSAVWEWMEIVA